MPPKERERFIAPTPAVALTLLKQSLSNCKPDFKGNLGPKIVPKRMADIEREKKQKLAQLPKDADEFRPHMHAKESISMSATRVHKILPKSAREVSPDHPPGTTSAEADPNHPNNNRYHQVLNEKTGKPLFESVLQWEEDPEASNWEGRRTGRRVFSEKYESVIGKKAEDMAEGQYRTRATRQDVEDLTPRHRTALIRQIEFSNPKFTAQSSLQRPLEHWDPMSQLLAHAYVNPPKAKVPKRSVKSSRATQRNNVRLVALMRSTARKTGAWH